MIGLFAEGGLTGLNEALRDNLILHEDIVEYSGTISKNALEGFVKDCSSILIINQGLITSNAIRAAKKFNVKSNFLYTRHESTFPKNEGEILRPEFFDVKGQNYNAVRQLGKSLEVDNILVPNSYTKDFVKGMFYEEQWDTSTKSNPIYPFKDQNITVAPMIGIDQCFDLSTEPREDIIVCVNRGGIDRPIELFCQLETKYNKIVIGASNKEQDKLNKLYNDVTFIPYTTRSSVAKFLKKAKYAFYPFTCYVQGLSMYEAIACGTPVITYDKNFYDSKSSQPDDPITKDNGVLCRQFSEGLKEAEGKKWLHSAVASTLDYASLNWEKNIEDIIRNRLL